MVFCLGCNTCLRNGRRNVDFAVYWALIYCSELLRSPLQQLHLLSMSGQAGLMGHNCCGAVLCMQASCKSAVGLAASMMYWQTGRMNAAVSTPTWVNKPVVQMASNGFLQFRLQETVFILSFVQMLGCQLMPRGCRLCRSLHASHQMQTVSIVLARSMLVWVPVAAQQQHQVALVAVVLLLEAHQSCSATTVRKLPACQDNWCSSCWARLSACLALSTLSGTLCQQLRMEHACQLAAMGFCLAGCDRHMKGLLQVDSSGPVLCSSATDIDGFLTNNLPGWHNLGRCGRSTIMHASK